ncbi:hypothetical protein BSKO_12015 [Bryopsis sp. KO-2023]|nr:hypothetical protein BSKO_12015 [Bryopsis sp. KO-2023]
MLTTTTQLWDSPADILALKQKGGVQGVQFLPFLVTSRRHIVGWLGGITATKENIQRLLRPGRSVVFLHPGGLAEMCLASWSKERVHLKHRKGFVRLAVEGGHCLFPMYIFGQSEILSLWCPNFLVSISRKFRFPIGFLYGRRKDILVVASKPIEVGKPLSRDHPDFAAKVEEIHEKFLSEVARVFDQYKTQYGWPHKKLEML